MGVQDPVQDPSITEELPQYILTEASAEMGLGPAEAAVSWSASPLKILCCPVPVDQEMEDKRVDGAEEKLGFLEHTMLSNSSLFVIFLMK